MKLQKSSITFFVNIGEQTAKNLPHPTNSFSDYLNGNYAEHLFMFPTGLQSRHIAYDNKLESKYQRRF